MTFPFGLFFPTRWQNRFRGVDCNRGLLVTAELGTSLDEQFFIYLGLRSDLFPGIFRCVYRQECSMLAHSTSLSFQWPGLLNQTVKLLKLAEKEGILHIKWRGTSLLLFSDKEPHLLISSLLRLNDAERGAGESQSTVKRQAPKKKFRETA